MYTNYQYEQQLHITRIHNGRSMGSSQIQDQETGIRTDNACLSLLATSAFQPSRLASCLTEMES